MKLFRVNIEYDVLVVAEDDEAALTAVRERHASDELQNCLHNPAGVSCTEVTSLSQVNKEWHGAYPYDASETTSEILQGAGE